LYAFPISLMFAARPDRHRLLDIIKHFQSEVRNIPFADFNSNPYVWRGKYCDFVMSLFTFLS
jgi:hypothetical protein